MTEHSDKVRVGVSACLLGQNVRYDGQHKLDAFVVDQLGPLVEWVAVCPEVEVGMGVPREPVRLVRRGPPGAPLAMVAIDTGTDWTVRMNALAARRVQTLAGIAGYVLKSRSPSCGMEGVDVYQPGADTAGPAAPTRDGVGLFARALRAQFPDLPIEEEGRLSDPLRPELRASFIARIFAYHRLHHL